MQEKLKVKTIWCKWTLLHLSYMTEFAWHNVFLFCRFPSMTGWEAETCIVLVIQMRSLNLILMFIAHYLKKLSLSSSHSSVNSSRLLSSKSWNHTSIYQSPGCNLVYIMYITPVSNAYLSVVQIKVWRWYVWYEKLCFPWAEKILQYNLVTRKTRASMPGTEHWSLLGLCPLRPVAVTGLSVSHKKQREVFQIFRSNRRQKIQDCYFRWRI